MTASEAKKLSEKFENTNCWENISEYTKEKIIKSCEKGDCYCIIEPLDDFDIKNELVDVPDTTQMGGESSFIDDDDILSILENM
jgi:hypothetical protein